MPSFSKASINKLETCDPRLQILFKEVVKKFDCTVVCGFRGEAEQNAAVQSGASQKEWPTSKHNKLPSLAVDVVPYPIDWQNTNQMRYFAGYVKGVADTLGIPVRWGGDFNRNNNPSDDGFKDLPHYEID